MSVFVLPSTERVSIALLNDLNMGTLVIKGGTPGIAAGTPGIPAKQGTLTF